MLPWLLALSLLAPKPVQIFFVRHGETVANATGRYNGRTVDAFSERGQKQVAGLTQTLATLRFDAILVSPSPRALRTIAPYLRAHGLTAEVWPELYECCDAHTRRIKGPTSAQVRYGAKIKLPADLAPLFRLLPGRDRYIEAPSYEDGLRQIRTSVERLQRLYWNSGKSVLIVGHSLAGGRMLELLQGRPMLGRIRPENGRLMRFQQVGSGLAPVGR